MRRSEARGRWFAPALVVALAVTLTFLTLPVVAIFVRSSPGDLVAALDDPGVLDALRLSLRTTLMALAIIVVVGTPAAYLLATRTFRGHALVVTLVELPLVLPPAVAGVGLLAAVGQGGIVGGAIEDAGLRLALETAGVVVALTFVAAPFFIRGAQTAFAAVDRSWLEASRTLGASEARTFLRVAVPAAAPGMLAGLALAWGRAVGEFGATLIFAGSFRGRTQTAPLAIYERLGTDFDAALALSAVLVIVSGTLLLSAKLLGGQGVAVAADRRRAVAPGDRARDVRRGGLAGHRRRARDRARVAPLRLRLSGLRAVRPHDRLAERRLRAAGHGESGAPPPRARAARPLRHRGARRRPAADAVGRERQRVALTRALAPAPQALLLDSGVPVLLVTYDFTEAAVLGDRVAVIDAGRIVQQGTAGELAAAPASAFVADFTGAVVLTGVAREGASPGDLTIVELDGGGTATSTDRRSGPVALSVHPWEIALEPAGGHVEGSMQNRLEAEVLTVTQVGNRVRVGLAAPQPLVAEITGAAVGGLHLAPGVRVTATWKATATRLVSL